MAQSFKYALAVLRDISCANDAARGHTKATPASVGRVLVLVLFACTAPFASAQSTAPAAEARTAVRVCRDLRPGQFACHALRAKPTAKAGEVTPFVTPSGFGPADLQSAYKLDVSRGSGRIIAIVDAQDDPNAESDLAVYRAQFGLPPCTAANGCFRKVNQTGASAPLPQPDGGWAEEISLDLDMVSAACPNCGILLVEATSANSNDLGTAVNTAAAQAGVVAVSNSYGGSESSSDPGWCSSSFTHPGVAITASSGDGGFGVESPAACPNVTAVGGTSLTVASNDRGWLETVWGSKSNADGGAGSGCSTVESKPAYQLDTGCSKRTVADVSAVADPNTGVAVYDTFTNTDGVDGWAQFGGTSVASPLIAAIYGLATPAGVDDFPVTYAYMNPGALFDVTSGTNGSCSPTLYLCTGEVGYDGPTGLGTPNGTTAFGPPGPPTVVSLTPNMGSGSPRTFSVVISDPSGVSDLKTTHLLFNTTTANQTSACSVFYSVGSNQLYIYNNAGSTLSAPVTPGSATTVSNNQCTLAGTGSSFSKAGDNLTLNVALTFTSTFTGLKNMYVYAAGNDGLNTGWVKEGTWTP